MKSKEEKNEQLVRALTDPALVVEFLQREMTKEEAGQIILEDDGWISCKGCEGEGGWAIRDELNECSRCQGNGGFYRPEYVAACTLLDLKLPSRISSHHRYVLAAQIHMFTQATELQQFYMESLGRSSNVDVNWKLSFEGKNLPSFFPPWAKQ